MYKQRITGMQGLLQLTENAPAYWYGYEPTPAEDALFEGRVVLVEYSGGRDSMAATLWLRDHYPDASVELIYVDMGADWPGYAVHVWESAEWFGYPLRVLHPRTTVVWELLRRKKWPHYMGPWCHAIMHEALDAILPPPDEVVIVRGQRLAQSSPHSRLGTSRHRKYKRNKAYDYFAPVYTAPDDQIMSCLQHSGAPIWRGYDTGHTRTACWCCPGQRAADYRRMYVYDRLHWDAYQTLERVCNGGGCWSDPDNNNGTAMAARLAGVPNATHDGRRIRRTVDGIVGSLEGVE